MEFSPKNPMVQLCIQGMQSEAAGNWNEALSLFQRAWDEATDEHEKFLAAFYIARQQPVVSDEIKWLETALQLARKLNNDAVKPAFPLLYENLCRCYTLSGDLHKAEENKQLAQSSISKPTDAGPFFHGTKADLPTGTLLTAGKESNYKSNLIMNHIYFTAQPGIAGLAAAMAKGDGQQRVYVVEPSGEFENDPNVTNLKFPGNPTRSYRSQAPVKIVGELKDWAKLTPEDLEKWKRRWAKSSGDIIN